MKHYKYYDNKGRAAMLRWWHNIRADGGMRLTPEGYRIFDQELGIQHYRFDITDPARMTSERLLEMDKKIQSPYYIMAKHTIPQHVILFGGAEAVAINLYGTFERWLDNYQP